MHRIVVVGGGFAGFWSAVAAAREVHERHVAVPEIAVTLVSRDEYLCIRPRLYEREPERMRVSMLPQLALAGVEFVCAEVEGIDVASRQVAIKVDGRPQSLTFDRLVLATGSVAVPPPIAGLREYGFSIDDYAQATRLAQHLRTLADRPDGAGRFTAVVIGSGFTGLECAAELAGWMRELAAATGAQAQVRVLLIERDGVIGRSLGEGLRDAIATAIADLGIETRVDTAVEAITHDAVTLAGGETIPALTVVATTGMRAQALAAGIGKAHDALGRVSVDAALMASDAPGVFAAGDTAAAWADDAHPAYQSCQHALLMGKVAGANAVRDLTGQALIPYSHPNYVTCLDLGEWGAVFSLGWDRQVAWTGGDAKIIKQTINGQWIYPPQARDRAALFAAAVPSMRGPAGIESAKKFYAGVIEAERFRRSRSP